MNLEVRLYHHGRGRILAAVLMPCLCQAAAAQEIVPLPPSDNATPRASGQGSGRSLTLADLEAIAMANNPTLAQVAGTIEQQRGMWEQVGLYPNPLAGYLTAASNDPTQRNNGIFLSQEIVTAKKRQFAREVELQELNRLGWEQHAQRMRVLNDLRIRYYEVLAQESIAIASRRSVRPKKVSGRPSGCLMSKTRRGPTSCKPASNAMPPVSPCKMLAFATMPHGIRW